ncbi:hypothetical protein SMU36_05420 [Streptococcus mutans 4VF1]|nr:hypothetical protein SMU36_05420 [Streptococcus mutans 4VF1]EMC34101.1 hypothetical protein SMU89_02617 [Streptococcus mutans NLML1]
MVVSIMEAEAPFLFGILIGLVFAILYRKSSRDKKNK